MLEQVQERELRLRHNPELRVVSSTRHPALSSIVTNNAEMHRIFSVLTRVAETGSTVLILGESGMERN